MVNDAREMRSYFHPDGFIMRAELLIDNSIIMLSEATDKYPAYQFWAHYMLMM